MTAYLNMSSSYTQGSISRYQWGEISFFFFCSSVHPWQPRQTDSSHPARTGQAGSIQITHCLAARVPSMANQSAAIGSFSMLRGTRHLSACVWLCVHLCMEGKNGERASQSQVILSEATTRLCDMKYGDGASLFVLIDTNEQRLDWSSIGFFFFPRLKRGWWDAAIGLKV